MHKQRSLKCLDKYYEDMPDELTEKEAEIWAVKLGECIKTRMEKNIYRSFIKRVSKSVILFAVFYT